MIEFKNVTLQYHYETYALFENLQLVLDAPISTVLCDIQSGKTSLCKLILGQELPNSGEILVDGKKVETSKKSCNVSALYLSSQNTFFPNRSVLHNLQYPLKVRKMSNDRLVLQLAEKFGLQDVLKTKVKKLNVRQKKLLALARGLTVERDVVLIDGFFDDTLDDCDLCQQKILECFSQCSNVVIFTANPQLAVGKTYLLDGGKCVFCGTAEEAQSKILELEWLANKI